MESNLVQFDLVSPERLLVSEAYDMVVVPGSEGDFGVLPRHAPMIATLRPGVIDIYENGVITERLFVAGGFAEVTPERLTVLAEEAIPLSDIDSDATKDRLKTAKEAFEAADTDTARAEAEAEIGIAEAMLAAIAKMDGVRH
ncbi:MAG: F0F1 ATP synthase subunit epsilon [Alphaproteobacteria bacterium]|jgi:F-type H+-transporting ATPase subunit epsilon|nr:F0F1 ATP synthase subunit epsilon [Alphaproteobacteria bacterium]